MTFDQNLFVLNQEQWAKFNEMLKQSPSVNEKLKKLLTTKFEVTNI
jgi:uncharacterized protein (DUF1778 family)